MPPPLYCGKIATEQKKEELIENGREGARFFFLSFVPVIVCSRRITTHYNRRVGSARVGRREFCFVWIGMSFSSPDLVVLIECSEFTLVHPMPSR